LRARIGEVRTVFTKGPNLIRSGTETQEVLMHDTPIHVDFTRFTSAGHGTIYGAGTDGLRVGQRITITDDEADTFEAEVLEVCGDAARIRVHWDKVLRTV
jgi:hypothetical protein